jgi:hypothetical protein
VSRGNILLKLARAALEESLGGPAVQVPDEPWLDEQGACFVSLHLKHDDSLRGCIGSIEAHRPLREDVVENAKAAAHRDPRFNPLRRNELAETRVEVTLLSPVEPLEVSSEAEALAALRPGVDGVILQWGGRRGVFIPQVWEQLPEPAEFLAALRRKAGLPGGWQPGTRLSRFTASHWEEESS